MNARPQTAPAPEHEQTQLTLFKDGPYDEFCKWKTLPGAGHVLRDLYALAASYAARYHRTGVRASVKLICELERDRIKLVRSRAQRQGISLPSWKGYALNNTLTAQVARHILEHKPAWEGLFELRSSPGQKKRQWALIVETSS